MDITVLDEADHMADLGFLPVVRRLLDMTPADGQRMLFSATLDGAVDVIARRFLHRPARHSVDADSKPPEITHHLLTVTPADRVGVIATLASGEGRVLIFTRTKHGARKLVKQLGLAGTLATELHGNLTQGARTRNLAAFANGEVNAPGRDRHRRPRHPRRRHRPGGARRPADRAQGLHPPVRPDRPRPAPRAPWSPCRPRPRWPRSAP